MLVSPVPFGLGTTKPQHFRDMARVAWRNRDRLPYAWRVLTRGVCDGCALGSSGLRDWTIDGVHLCMVLELARAAKPEDYARVHFPDAGAIRADIERCVPAYAGIATLSRQGDQFQWGGERLCADRRFGTDDGRAHLVPVRAPAAIPDGDDRFLLATRRGKQFNSMIQAKRDPLTGAERDHVLMARADAERLGLSQGAPVRLTSPHGAFAERVFFADVAPGTVQGHWPEVNVLIAHGRIDARGGVPDYSARVRIEAADRLGITLCGFMRGDEVVGYTHPERIRAGDPS